MQAPPEGLPRQCCRLAGSAYVGINSIRHSDEFFRYLGTIFSISNFNQSVLGCIEADFCDQICVGKPLTRSTISTFFSRAHFSKFC